jgi:Type IV secretion system pilin
MLLAKKYLLSFLFIVSLGILQFNMLPLISPAKADSTLINQQSLLQESTAGNYGNNPKDVKVIVLQILKTLLAFIAIVMVVLLIVAGFQYMTSAGNEAKLKEAMGRIQALVVGLVIILASWGITNYLIKWLVCSTTATSGNCASIW